MSKPHKHAEVIHAIADGKAVQFKDAGEWRDFDDRYYSPIEAPELEWRIKPEPKPEQPIDTDLLADIIRSFGYTSWAQSYELADAILQKVGAK